VHLWCVLVGGGLLLAMATVMVVSILVGIPTAVCVDLSTADRVRLENYLLSKLLLCGGTNIIYGFPSACLNVMVLPRMQNTRICRNR